MGIELQKKGGRAVVVVESRGLVTKNTANLLESEDNESALPDLGMAAMLRYRVRYLAA